MAIYSPLPQEELGKSYQNSSAKISNPSKSVNEINVPEVKNLLTEFVYNFYTKDERVRPFQNTSLNASKVPRYTLLSWTSPSVSVATVENSDTHKQARKTIKDNASVIMSEDNFFNLGYVSQTFSNFDVIEQGTSDLENYSRLSRQDTESVSDMSVKQIKDVFLSKDISIQETYKKTLLEDYQRLADFPASSLGLRVLDSSGRLSRDDGQLIRSITNDISLSFKINSAVLPDIFKDSTETLVNTNYDAMSRAYSDALRGQQENPVKINAISTQKPNFNKVFSQQVQLLGYIVDRYLVLQEGFKKDATFYVEDIATTRFEDKTVLYGVSYVYTVRVVASVPLLSYTNDGSSVVSSTVYVSSRPTSCPVECFEYTPPPEPNDLKFNFNYEKRNLIIGWDMPVNSQNDVKQFQVFRRKSIKEPFELIAQYGFDDSEIGPYGSRYKTDEVVDSNNFSNMSLELKPLVRNQDERLGPPRPVYMHIDEDFTVDPEFFISSEYIYAVCAVDAHGMISNYSSQHHVTFDSYKNKLMTKVICDAGSPRQYPNMKLRVDAFKDVIRVEGDSARRLEVYFTPEYLSLRDDRNAKIKVVEAQTPNNRSPYYLLQLINLDNQKMQLLRINIKDPNNLSEKNLTG